MYILTFRVSRPNNDDKAIGKVQFRRNGGICTVRGKITPEEVWAKTYSISCTSDGENEENLIIVLLIKVI